MIKIFTLKYLTILISICIMGGGIALACADGWGEEFGVSNFTPEVFVDTAYSPFFYSWQYYYGIGHEEQQDARFNDANIKDWSGYLKGQLNREELSFLLTAASATAIDSAIAFNNAKINTLPASMQTLPGLKKQHNKNLGEFFSYLSLAKKAEAFALNNYSNSWDYQDKTSGKKTFNATLLNKQLQNGLTISSDIFLKERYWFQLLRSYFFNGTPQQTIESYNGGSKSMPHNTLYFRTMGYMAGAYYKLKNYSKANYFYSLVYDSCNEMKTAAHYSFHPQEEKDWRATLAMCRNKEEQITLWQMLGIFYGDEQRAMKEIYALNPASDKLDLLLARSINKYEQKFNGGGNDYSMIDLPRDTVAARTLPAIVTQFAMDEHTAKPWVWQLAAGYIRTLDGKYTDASGWLLKAEKTLPHTTMAQAQWRLLKLINSIAATTKIDTRFENAILPHIEWLKNLDATTLPNFRYTDAYAWLKQQMAKKYRAQKEWVKAECFSSTAAFYASNKNVEDLKTFLSKPAKNAYETVCSELSLKKIADIYEFQAVKLAYADSLDAALGMMQKAGEGAQVVLPGNPFNGRIQDCHDCDHEAAQKVKYSKLAFLKKLQEMETRIATGEDKYTNASLLANAFYNISHFGNARAFYEGKVLGDSHSDPGYIDSVFRGMITATAKATKYYTLAYQQAVTDEQKAKCQYMLAKCQRNQWYNDHVYNKDDYPTGSMVDLRSLDGFKNLKQYASTQYYKDVLKECGYFKQYIRKQ